MGRLIQKIYLFYFCNVENLALEFLIPAEFLDEFLCSGGDVAGKVDGVDALEDDVVGLHGVGPGEGRSASEQLEHEDPQGPVVG